MAIAAGIVVVSMDREDRYGDVHIGVFVVDMGEGAFEDFVRIGEELELTRLHAHTVLAERSHDLIHGLARGFVIVEEITAE
jgi:hypothetical protein